MSGGVEGAGCEKREPDFEVNLTLNREQVENSTIKLNMYIIIALNNDQYTDN